MKALFIEQHLLDKYFEITMRSPSEYCQIKIGKKVGFFIHYPITDVSMFRLHIRVTV